VTFFRTLTTPKRKFRYLAFPDRRSVSGWLTPSCHFGDIGLGCSNEGTPTSVPPLLGPVNRFGTLDWLNRADACQYSQCMACFLPRLPS